MATEEEYLKQKLKEIQRLGRDQAFRTIAAAPGTFNSVRNEGATAGRAYAQSWRRPTPTGPDKEALLAQKADLLGKLVDLDKTRTQERGGVAKENVGKRHDAFKSMLEFIKGVHGDEIAADASVAKAFNDANVNLAELKHKSLQNYMEASGVDAGIANDITRRLTGFGVGSDASMYGESGVVGPTTSEHWQAVKEMLQTAQSTNNPAAVRAVQIAVHTNLLDNGFTGGLQDPALQGAVPTEFIDLATKMQADAAAMNTDLDAAAQTIANETADEIARRDAALIRGVRKLGNPKVEALLEAGLKVRDAFGVGSDDDLIKSLEAVEKDATPQDPGARQKIYDALDALDNMLDMPVPPASAREARDQLYADPVFQKWMADNGFQDERTAFKALKGQIKGRIDADRAADRQRMEEMRRSGTGAMFSQDAVEESKATAAPVLPGSVSLKADSEDVKINARKPQRDIDIKDIESLPDGEQVGKISDPMDDADKDGPSNVVSKVRSVAGKLGQIKIPKTEPSATPAPALSWDMNEPGQLALRKKIGQTIRASKTA